MLKTFLRAATASPWARRAALARFALLGALWGAQALASSAEARPDPLSTVAEQSGFTRTGRFDEVVHLCAEFQKTYPRAVRCTEFGRTPEGRPMLALIASQSGVLSPADKRRQNLPAVLVQGGIHAGEIDGKDAGFLLLRELLQGKRAPGLLKQQVLVFVPVFNVDGHERFAAWNRPNQRGPEEMGWRTTAQNHNLNRDYAKAQSPEMQAMLRLVNQWDPLLTLDLHTTNGAQFEHDVSVQVEPLHGGDPALRQVGRALRDGILGDLTAQGSLPLPFYPSFRVEDDPSSGIDDMVFPPRFSSGYFLLRNRFGMLVETHSWKDYATRVRVTHRVLVSALQRVAQEGAAWQRQATEADIRSAQLAGQPATLSHAPSDKTRMVDFRGYAYQRGPSDISGAFMTLYDESRPQVWSMPVRDDVQPALQVTTPLAGYLVPAAQAGLVAVKLKLHDIEFRALDQGLPRQELETFRASSHRFAAQSSEGQQRLSVQGRWQKESRELPPGSLFVPMAQAKSQLVAALLEPLGPDSLLAWGFFNNHFESKEYMEAYVAEAVAREQLAADPALAAAFRDKLHADPEFAKSPAARLAFFARRHSSWDERLGLYPVMRTDEVPPLNPGQSGKPSSP